MRAALVILALLVAGPAVAKPRPAAPFNFFSIFQQPESPRASKRSVRHVANTRHTRKRGAVVVRPAVSGGIDSETVVEVARSQIGNGAIYGRRNLWCARFMNYVLEKTGHHGTGSDLARSFASLPRTSLRVGAIAVMSRRGGGHVGVVSGVTAEGDPIVISGNNGGRVREAVYPRRRVLAFVEAQ